jgi:hypothetical protein
VTGEHARVGEVEVDIAVAVDVGERRAASSVDHDRRMLVERRHPGHRHAVRHVWPGAFEKAHAARPKLGEEPHLALA